MAAKDFTLKYNGQTKTLAAWGISDCAFEQNDFAAETVTFLVAGRQIDASDLFAYGSTVEIFYPNGTRWFYGRVEPWSRDGSGPEEKHVGRLVNPWFYFKQIYKQTFRVANGFTLAGVATGYTNYSTPRVILNIGPGSLANGGNVLERWSTGQQLADVVNYAKSLGFPMQLGKVAPWSTPYSSPQNGITMEDVIRRQFEKEPDFTCVWDYTTTPPTIHFLKASTANLDPALSQAQQAALLLTTVAIDLDKDVLPEQITLKPRPDWQRSYVRITYDQTNSINGITALGIQTDVYPDPPPQTPEDLVRGVELFVDLAGATANTTSQSGQFSSAPFDPTDVAQWQLWKASINESDVQSAVVVTDANTDDPVLHPAPTITTREGAPYNPANAYEILDGSWAPWMANNNQAVSAQKVRVNAWLLITKKRGLDGNQATEYIPVHADFVACSFNTASVGTAFTYYSTSPNQVAEGIPVGLAKSMYLAWQSLAIEGTLMRIEDVITSKISRQNCLNFKSTKRPEWTNVIAPVRRCSGTIDTGMTRIEFGAPLKITGNALAEIYRSSRNRTAVINFAYYFGGAMSVGGTVQHPQKHHPRSVEHGTPHPVVHVVSKSPNPVPNVDPGIVIDGKTGIMTVCPPGTVGAPATGRGIFDPSKLKGSDGNWHTMEVQEVTTCEPDGTQWTRIGWYSDKFKAPGQP